MHIIRTTTIAVGCILALAGSVSALEWNKGSTEEQLKALNAIQLGLGSVMIEYSHRFGTAHYAAKGGNWDLASYQIEEMREIQEVAEYTRPGRKAALKEFETKYLDPLAAAAKAKDAKKFDAAFDAAYKGCNACHEDKGFKYIHYVLPKESPSPLANTPQ